VSSPSCLFIGPFPPPVHGQSVATRDLADFLEAEGVGLSRIDWGHSMASKIASLPRRCARIAFGPESTVYLSVNANSGIVITAACALAAKLADKRLFLHHHSYRYIGEWDRGMAMLANAGGKETVHITNCPIMGRELAERYPAVGRWASLHNAGSVDPNLSPNIRPDRPITLGHMSNLTEAKGVGRVVDAFERFKARFPDGRLIVAGPARERFAQSTIDSARASFGEDFQYIGPVYGDAKKAFFEAIDIFVFPSLYRVETQGIVNLEALACGKPVVAFDQCCIGYDLGESGGEAIAKDGDFAAGLVHLAERSCVDWEEARHRARVRFDELFDLYSQERLNLLHEIGAA
jgi:glycosyltransferase involved in cell wall biosynthesis